MTGAPVKIAIVLGAGSLLLGGLVMAPSATAAAPATTATTAVAASSAAPDAVVPDAGTRTSLVAAWYQQFLRRNGTSDPGSQHWIVRLLRTEAPAAVLADFLRTPEAATKAVNDLYTVFLGRGAAGDAGAGYWVDGIVTGAFPAEWAEQNILASPEYQRRVASSDPQRGPQLVVAQRYRDVLGREANAGEIGYWSIQFEDRSNLGVLREIWYSPEAVDLRLASHYRDYLQRTANTGEIACWSPAEVKSDIGVVVAIASSAEYLKNSPTFLA